MRGELGRGGREFNDPKHGLQPDNLFHAARNYGAMC